MGRNERMIKLMDLILESGKTAGKLELVSTDVVKARKFATDIFKQNGWDIDVEMPNFFKNYKVAQSIAGSGKAKRNQMPTIDAKDVKDFQLRLSRGYIDINAPHAKETDANNPFPEGLSGNQAERWLQNGLPQHDGAKPTDDVIKVTKKSVPVKNLKPIQKQIYFDKSIKKIARWGTETSKKFMKKTTFIVSNDSFIIVGHHRYLSAMLVDPTQQVNTITIDLPMRILLPLALAYGDARGNQRNA